ncbi:MAG: hypothetical protein AAF585_16180 [Verrucomicrobiota bacterium]
MRLLFFLVCLALIGPGLTVAEKGVFELPAKRPEYLKMQSELSQLLVKGDHEGARAKLGELLQLAPNDAVSRYNLACVESLGGNSAQALVELDLAIDAGFRAVEVMEQDKDLDPLRDMDEFKTAVARARQLRDERQNPIETMVEPGEIKDGVAMVEESNTAFDFQSGMFQTVFDFPEGLRKKPGVITNDSGKAGDMLRSWAILQQAAGNVGDLYDNHDRDHSNFPEAKAPQLTRIEYGALAKKRNLDNGLQAGFLFNAVTMGNSSTAMTGGPTWRSQPRFAYVSQDSAARLFAQYANNHIYFYPEHRDHDETHGDVFPANTPYVITSQGSSGSDQPFMEAIAQCLAAFRPKVKERLKREGALMPAVQMLFRYSNKNVQKRDIYLSGEAHPPVFDSKNLDRLGLVNMTHDIKEDSLPPVAQLKVLKEEMGVAGRDFFGSGGERIFDTPGAIARVYRSMKLERRMIVSAEPSRDLHDRPMKVHWRVLRGDESKIEVKPLNDGGSVAEIKVGYHPEPIPSPGTGLKSNRVDIGVFVENEKWLSAPAFVTFYFLANEVREYDEKGRILVLDYLDENAKNAYVDPLVDAKKNWRDEFTYDEDGGKMKGWTRTMEGGEVHEFTPEGLLVVKKAEDGSPEEVKAVLYGNRAGKDGAPAVGMAFSNETLSYADVQARLKAAAEEAKKKNDAAEDRSQ